MRKILIVALMCPSAHAELLQIIIYDTVPLTKQVGDAAFDDLRGIFRASRIDLRLIVGDPAAAEASLIIYPATPARGRQVEAVCEARRDIMLKIIPVAPPGLKETVLGIAQPLASEGLNVRIFDDRVRDAACRENLPHATVLSHVIAHEIGHVLLRTSNHSSRGLMSSVWTKSEYGWMQKALMHFSDQQSQQMRTDLSRSTCQGMPELRRSLALFTSR